MRNKDLVLSKDAEITSGVLKGTIGEVVSYDKETNQVKMIFAEGDIIEAKVYISIIEQEEDEIETESREDGYCPYCGHHCKDIFIGISGRFINDRYYGKVECSKCHKQFDQVFNLKLVRSQRCKTTEELISED